MSTTKREEVITIEDADPFNEFPEMMDIENILAKERSLLLGLPAELLQHVLTHMDTGAFFIILLSCKIIFGAAHSKRVLLQHLNRMPGLRLGLQDQDSLALLGIFRKRAAKGFYGAGVLADITRYSPCDDSTGMSKSALIPGKPTLLATAHQHGQVRIYELTEKYVRQKAELRTQEQFDHDLHINYRMEILRMAFSNDRDLAVLCRPKMPETDSTPFADQAENRPGKRRLLKLITFHRCHAKTKGHFYSSDQQEIRDIRFKPHHEPVGLALGSKGNACITWRCPSVQEVTEVVLYGRDSNLMSAQDYDPHPNTLIFHDPTPRNNDTLPPRLIFTPSFSSTDRVLNFHRPGSPIHNWYTNSTTPTSAPSGPIHTNTAWVALDPDQLSQCFKIGIPFHGHHTSNVAVDYSNARMCRCSYLALGQATDVDEGAGNEAPMFILQAETDSAPTACSHTPNLDQGRRSSSWTAIALLAGWRNGTSSLGTVVAISQKATHIAAATWDYVLIWSLEPNMLHQGGLEHWFPKVDYNGRKGIGRLRPVRLQCEGVVYGMVWVGETTLYAVTDRGLLRWECGVLAEGGREELALQYDAWKETAVAMGMPR